MAQPPRSYAQWAKANPVASRMGKTPEGNVGAKPAPQAPVAPPQPGQQQLNAGPYQYPQGGSQNNAMQISPQNPQQQQISPQMQQHAMAANLAMNMPRNMHGQHQYQQGYPMQNQNMQMNNQAPQFHPAYRQY